MNNIVFVTAKVLRNFKDYKFMPKLEQEKFADIEQAVETALGAGYHKIVLNSADQGIISYLAENNLISNNSRIVFVNKNKSISVSIFEDEHVIIRSSANHFCKTAIKNATELAKNLADKIAFAYNDEYGYLFSNLGFIGSGLKLEGDIDLSSIVSLNKIEKVIQNIKNLGFTLRCKDKNIFTLSTNCNLGFSETEIVEEFEKMLNNLQEIEVESAKMLLASNHDEVLDKVYRNEAILSSAYKISEDELKHMLSLLRVGLNLNLINIEDKKLKELQKLVTNKFNSTMAKDDVLLAEKVKKIIKGE